MIDFGIWQQICCQKKSADMPVYTQALMDFGATWCTSRKPVCLGYEKKCPFAKYCQANLSDQVAYVAAQNQENEIP